jgi:flagella basal body P-ring formation protein FlgA
MKAVIPRVLLGLGLVLIATALFAQPAARDPEQRAPVFGNDHAPDKSDLEKLAPKSDRASVPRLKSFVTVTRDIVRIGDFVENAGAVSDIAVFRSPDPGSTGSVPAERVLEAVRAHNLLLIDSAGVTDVEVTRVSRAIVRAEIERRIVRAFATHFTSGEAGRFAVTFDREPRTIHVEPQVSGDLQVARASYDPRSTRFDVTFELPAGGAQPLVRYTGRLVETVPAVVLTRPLNRGETIRASDVIVEQRPKSEMTSDAVSSPDEIAGMAARQALRAGPPLRRADLVKPDLVKRDEPVTIIYEVPGVVLTIRGKAIDSGAEGDLINVLNIQSKRTVQGVVTGPGRVTMAAPQPITVTEAADAARQSE